MMKRTTHSRLAHSLGIAVQGVLIALLLALTGGGPAAAQRATLQGSLRFQRLTVEDGLLQNTVNAILQDRLGFMWFGTDEGLNKYDGYTFTTYQHNLANPTSLADNAVTALFEDSQGNLWVGTAAGLDRFDRQSETFTHYGSSPNPGSIRTIQEDSQGRLWIAAEQDGLWLLERGASAPTRFRFDPAGPGLLEGKAVNALVWGSDGSLWTGAEAGPGGGLARLDPAGRALQYYPHKLTDPNSPTSDQVHALLSDRQGNLWIGTDGGLNRFDPQTGLFSFYLHSSIDPFSLGDNRVTGLLEDRRNTLWIATPQGLNRFDPQTGRFTRYVHNPEDPDSLSSSQILALYEDRSGILWIGTRGGGLSLYKPSAHKFSLYRAAPLSGGTNSSSILSILAEESSLWVGTGEAGLYRIDRGSGEQQVYRHTPQDPDTLSNNTVTALAADGRGGLWVGTYGGGLNHLDPDSGRFTHYKWEYRNETSLGSNTVLSLYVAPSGTLWVGGMEGGLNRLDPGSNGFRHYRHDPQNPASLSDDEILTIYADRSGALWLGTFAGGLNRFDPVTETFQRFTHAPHNPNSLGSDQVYSIVEAPQGVLWVGTRDGLTRFDVTAGRFTRYTTQHGLPGNTICGLLADERGQVWISTPNGLARFDPRSGAFRSYTVEDGLQSREFNAGATARNAQGELFFGGVQGFNSFFPSEVVDNPTPPPMVITAFKVTAFKKGNQTVRKDLADGAEIRLDYRDDFISFEFAALDFNAPARNRFAYRLEGFDEAWVEAETRNFVSYSNLAGGAYTFRVRAANNDGVWNEPGIAVRVTVVPPVWETTWFRGLALASLLVAVWGGYRWRLRSIQQRARELELKVAELSQQVKDSAVAAERSRLARDLHDSVTQLLYSLTLLSEAGLRLLASGDLAASQKNQERLGEIAQQALQEMRLMVYQLRPPALAQAGLAGVLERRLEAVERRAGVTARLICSGEGQLQPQAEEDLLYLAQEALNNALKHAGSYTVTVRLHCEGEYVRLEVQDTGRGFDPQPAARSGGLGLTSMRERAERLGGRLEIESALGAGTCVRFTTFPQDGSVRGANEFGDAVN